MATHSQRVIWTALPDGYTDDGKFLRINVMVSPRLHLDAGADPAILSSFPAWLDWPGTIAGSRFALAIDDRVLELAPAWEQQDTERMRGSWRALFPGTTRIRTHAFQDMRGTAVLTYPLAQLATHIDALYRDVAMASPEELPQAAALQDGLRAFAGEGHDKPDPKGHLFGVVAAQLAGHGRGVPSETSGWRDHPAYRFSPGQAMELLSLYHRPMQAMDPEKPRHKQGKASSDDPHEEGASWPNYPRASLPAPEAFAEQIEFHEIVSTLGQHPFLLRETALVVPFLFPVDGVQPGDAKLRLEKVDWPHGDIDTAPDALPTMAVRIGDGRFVARSRTADGLLREGWLHLAEGPFALLQMDVDGAGLKLDGLQATLRQPREPSIEDDDEFPEERMNYLSAPRHEPPRLGLPSLRSAGLTLAQLRRDAAIRGLFDGAGALDDRLVQGQGIDLFAEDVTRGYRVDVLDATLGGDWQSLLRFDGRYQLLNSGSALDSDDEETTLRLGVTGSVDDSVPGVVKASEALFAWTGWSLAAPEPGNVIAPDDTTVPQSGTAPPGIPLDTFPEVHPGSLPSLRFGHEYQVRVRLADLAGGGVRWSPGLKAPEEALSEKARYLRYEPLEAPGLALVEEDVAPDDTLWAGESLARAALRSYNDTPGANAHHNPARVRRHVVPARVGHRFAELHGMLDKDGRVDPGLFDLLAEKDDPLAEKKVVGDDGVLFTYPVAKAVFAVPYLPDPLAMGVALRVYGLPEVDPAEIHRIPFYGDEWDPEAPATGWPHARPFSIVAVEGSPSAKWDPAEREFVVALPKAERARVRYGALLTPAGLELMKLARLLQSDPHGRRAWAKLEQAILSGAHWMFTPWRTLELVHAVQKPLVVPTPDRILASRHAGDIAARLDFSPPLHSKSTARLDVAGEWSEPFDLAELPSPGPALEYRQFSAPAFDRKISRLQSPDAGPVPIHGSHAFGDTRYRRVRYRIDATTRFREFMPVEKDGVAIRDSVNGEALKVTSDEVVCHVPGSAPPPPPQLVYVVPTFGWNRAFDGKDKRSWRHGGGLRVYLDRPWFATGYNEMLAVVLPTVFDQPAPDTAAKPLRVTQWGADPLWTTAGKVKAASPHTNDFPLAVWRSPLPDMQIAGYPEQERHVPTAHGLLEISGLRPGGSGDPVYIAPHAVGYDEDRGLWYADIVVRPKEAYFPFVRLALARYQPVSIPGAHLSNVVMTEFQQLVPDRLATVTDSSRQGVVVKKVAVYGIGPRNVGPVPRDRAQGGRVDIVLQRLPSGDDQDLGWVDVAPVPLPPPRPRVVGGIGKKAAKRRLGASSTTQRSVLLKQANEWVEAGRYIDVLGRPDLLELLLPPLIHEQEIALPQGLAKGDRLRLLVTESETYPGESGEASRQRIVYAEAIPL